MAVGGAGASPLEPRVSTGNPELDKILAGGLMPRRPYLIVGPSGTGKTTLALQFLCEGIRRGERCLVVTLEEPPNEMRINHRGLQPELDQVYVFDAIPDVMRYERAPFKDIAAVRASVPFSEVPAEIRRTPELSSVEVTFTALEQMLKMEVARRNYSRLVIDSLTALQYFCMKGVDETVGAQTFLRFLSDLRITTLLTVESPLEEVESPERLLARGEVRLFRWELEGKTVRAIGVEKFRGSTHDIRLHPYRISNKGLGVNLDVTISRDTRQVLEPAPVAPPAGDVPRGPATVPLVANLDDLESSVHDLATAGGDLTGIREVVAEAARVTATRPPSEAIPLYQRMRISVRAAVDQYREQFGARPPTDPPERAAAARRLMSGASDVRAGVPPIGPSDLPTISVRLSALRDALPAPVSRSTPPVATGPPVQPPTPAVTLPPASTPPPAQTPALIAPIPPRASAPPSPPVDPRPDRGSATTTAASGAGGPPPLPTAALVPPPVTPSPAPPPPVVVAPPRDLTAPPAAPTRDEVGRPSLPPASASSSPAGTPSNDTPPSGPSAGTGQSEGGPTTLETPKRRKRATAGVGARKRAAPTPAVPGPLPSPGSPSESAAAIIPPSVSDTRALVESAANTGPSVPPEKPKKRAPRKRKPVAKPADDPAPVTVPVAPAAPAEPAPPTPAPTDGGTAP